MASDILLRIGGIKGVSLWSPYHYGDINCPPVDMDQRAYYDDDFVKRNAKSVDLIPELSSYTEQVVYYGGKARVTHTLRLVTEQRDEVCESYMLRSWRRYGFAAHITLNTRKEIVVGHLRGESSITMLKFHSSESITNKGRRDQPLKEWVFTLCDDMPLL